MVGQQGEAPEQYLKQSRAPRREARGWKGTDALPRPAGPGPGAGGG